MQRCHTCQLAISDDAQECSYCGSPVQKDDDDARRRLLLRLRLETLASQTPTLASISAASAFTTLTSSGAYVVVSALILVYVILGLFIRPPVVLSALPDLVVTPLSLNFGEVVMGDSRTQPLKMTNNSGFPLHWTTNMAKASPVKLDRSSGELDPYGQVSVKATIETNGLAPRPTPYSVNISFEANKVRTVLKTTVTVIASGKLCVRPPRLDFGTLAQGTAGKSFVTVSNCGGQLLSWFIAPGAANWVTTNYSEGKLAPGEQKTVQVTVDTSQQIQPTSLTFESDKGTQVVPIVVTIAQQRAISVPKWSVDQTSLSPSSPSCVASGGSWTCTVTLTEDTNSQGNINWSSNSTSGAMFTPSSGVLPTVVSRQQLVTILSISCQNDTFTFYGAEGEEPQAITWSCNQPCMAVDQSALSISVMQGQTDASNTVTFTNCGMDMGNISISTATSDGAAWLNISPGDTGSLNESLATGMGQAIFVTVTSTNLQPGTYSGTITASITTSTGTATATTNVALIITPCFIVDQSTLSYTYPGPDGLQRVTFTNCGTYAGDVSISSFTSDGTGWLYIANNSQLSGSLEAGATATISFGVSGTGLAAGTTYQGTITATLTTNGSIASAPVSVSLTVPYVPPPNVPPPK